MKLRLRSNIMPSMAFLAALAGCGPSASSGNPDGGLGEVFIATTGNFADYRTWESFDGGPNARDGVPVDSPRIMYLNRRPPSGSKFFPVGTIVVKEAAGGQTFAMVKRGGDYNYTGARDWEWFEIADNADGKPVIIWRGPAPPADQGYGGLPIASCNVCHADSIKNDFVAGSALDLSGF